MKGIKKMLIVKKSSIISLCLISVLIVAGYLNYINTPLKSDKSVSVVNGGEEEIFEEPENYGEAKFVDSSSVKEDLRYERDKRISEIISMYKELKEDKTLSEDIRNKAAESALKLAGISEKENNMESLLKEKGYKNAVALITDDGVTISAGKSELSKTDIGIIRDVVISETEVTSDKIRIRNN